MEPLLLTEGDVGNLLNVSRSTVRKLMAAEKLKYCHVGRSLRFHREDVEATAEALRRESIGASRFKAEVDAFEARVQEEAQDLG